MASSLTVNELFLSLQGESSHAGKRCAFVRLAGCNLHCSYCDTGYAQRAADGVKMSVAQIQKQLAQYPVKLVEITGGEPLTQFDGVTQLAQTLLEQNYEVLLETNGSLPIKDLPAGVCRILDCKLPSSGMSEYNLYDNYQYLTPRDEVKLVIGDRADFDFGCEIIQKYDLPGKTPHLLASPVWGKVAFDQLADWVVNGPCPQLRMQIQMHKIIWGPAKTGV